MNPDFSTPPITPPKRPVFLTVLCILTFVSSALGIIGALFTPVMADFMIAFLTKMPGYEQEIDEQALLILKAGWGYYLTLMGLTILSLTGALMMWRLQKNGFHFYTISNIAIYCLPSLFLPVDFNILGLVFPGVFIALYALHLKFMH